MVKICATAMFEMLGRPKEHISSAMEQLIDVIGKEKGIVISKKTVHEPKVVEQKDKEGKLIPAIDGGELFTTFSEVEIEANNIVDIIRLSFKYMPAHIEVTEPTKFSFDNFDINAIVNEILGKMHHYDAIAKSALLQNQYMAKQLEALSGKSEKKTEGETPAEEDKAQKTKKSKK